MSHHDVRKTLWGIQDIAMNLGGPESRGLDCTADSP